MHTQVTDEPSVSAQRDARESAQRPRPGRAPRTDGGWSRGPRPHGDELVVTAMKVYCFTPCAPADRRDVV
jgi:hypothetical protein